MIDDRPAGLLVWQREGYPLYHANRQNLMLHAVTVPMFQAGSLALPAAFTGIPWLSIVGLAMMATAVLAQGRGHRMESRPPAPFRGPLDVFARLVAEQWITFPRFLISGGFARAWNGASTEQSSASQQLGGSHRVER